MTRCLWIGGAPGAGKSTIARRLAVAEDLPLQALDLWNYDHADRIGAPDLDADLARGPAGAADAFEDYAGERMPLVAADLTGRRLGAVPALVEGPQLHPRHRTGQPGWTVWLLPDPVRTRAAREERLAAVEQPGARARLEALTARDALLADRLRTAVRAAGDPWVEVGAHVDWADVAAQVRNALAPALEEAPRLPGDELGAQRAFENRTACRQGRLWQVAAGIAELPPYPFACECGTSGCDAVWRGTPDDYDRLTGRLVAHEDATGGGSRA